MLSGGQIEMLDGFFFQKKKWEMFVFCGFDKDVNTARDSIPPTNTHISNTYEIPENCAEETARLT